MINMGGGKVMKNDFSLVSKAEAAEMLNISIQTLARIVADGDLPMYKIRGTCKFDREDIDAYIRGCRQQAVKVIRVPRAKGRAAEGVCSAGDTYYPGMKVV